jgi:hypothetical protein
METVEVTTTRFRSLLARIASMEEQISIEPERSTVSLPIDATAWDAIQLRVAALEDNLLAAGNQPEADQLTDSALEAEYVAWRRVNGYPIPGLTLRLDIVAWTHHFARSRHLGRPEPSDESLEATFRQWFADNFPTAPNRQAVSTAIAWGRHLLGLGG